MADASRTALFEARLAGLVRRFGDELLGRHEGVRVPYPSGAARRVGDTLVVHPDDASGVAALGSALVLADRLGLADVELWLTPDAEPGARARQGAVLVPPVVVREIRGSATPVHLTPGGADAVELVVAEPAPIAPVADLPTELLVWVEPFERVGLTPLRLHDRLVGTHLGLEVARVTADEHGALLEVGVGKADRELTALVHLGAEPDVNLARALEPVRRHRAPGSVHPLARLARSHWMRSAVVADPSMVGCSTLTPVAPIEPVDTVDPAEPAAAVGTTDGGEPCVAVFLAGLDPAFVSTAVDVAQRDAPGARILVVLPDRDHYPIVDRLAARLPSARVVPVPAPWQA